jgi:flagellar motor switch protein FliM
MSSAPSPVEAPDYILERLVGETAEPDRITEAARKLGQRTLPAIARNVNQYLCSPIEIEIEAIELGRFAQALAGTGEHNAVIIAPSANSPDALLLDLDIDAIALLVAGFLGADGELPASPIGRPLSKIEMEVAATSLREVAEAVNGTGPRSMKLRVPIPEPFTGADIAKQVLRDGPSARIVFLLKSPCASGRLSMSMPQRVLLSGRGEGAETADATASGGWSERLGEEVRKSSVSLDAIVPLTSMSLGALAALKVGQVLEMPATAKSSTRLASRNKTLFVCEFGKLDQNYSIRIKHAFDEHQDFVENLLAR